MRGRWLWLMVFALLAPLATAPTASARPKGLALTAQLSTFANRANHNLPADAGVVVIDPATGTTLHSKNADEALLPASTMKLVTAAVALETYSANHRFETTVQFNSATHNLYLVGGGDPTLSRKRLKRLAADVKAALTAGTKLNVYSDNTLFPNFKPPAGWVNGYVPGQVPPVTALELSGTQSNHPAKTATQAFVAILRAIGLKASYKGSHSASGDRIARTTSVPVPMIVKRMLKESDNDIAEHLFRLNAIGGGAQATWDGASGYALDQLAALGVDTTQLKLHDGSGLSRKDRLTALALGQILSAARSAEHADLGQILDSHLLPVAGGKGTLLNRFRSPKSKCAVGQVEAKTGSLKDVISLAGYVRTDEGVAVFAIVVNHVKRGAGNLTRSRIDYVVAGLASGC